jgi:hypothetical protein
VIAVHAERDAGKRCQSVLECLCARDEIGFRVQFGDCALRCLHNQAHEPFSRHTVGLLCGFCDLVCAQAIERRFEIAERRKERPSAIHHTRTGSVAKCFDEGGVDFGHVVLSVAIQTGVDITHKRVHVSPGTTEPVAGTGTRSRARASARVRSG